MSLDKRGKVAQRGFLSCRLPHLLAHRVAQLALEFSPTHRTPGRPPGGSVSSSLSLGSIGPWHGVRGVPTHPRSSPLAQDSSWSRTALRAAAHSLPHSVATRRHASVSVTARHGSRALSKDRRSFAMVTTERREMNLEWKGTNNVESHRSSQSYSPEVSYAASREMDLNR